MKSLFLHKAVHPIFRVGGVGGGGEGDGGVPYFSYKTRPMYHRCIIEMSCTGILANNEIFKKTRILIYLTFSLVNRDICEQFLALKHVVCVQNRDGHVLRFVDVHQKKS